MSLLYFWAKFMKKIRSSAIRNCIIDKTSKVEAGSHVINSSFGKHSFCGYDCEIYNTDVGSFCSIANGVTIGGSQHAMQWVSTSPVFRKGRDSVKKKYSEFEYHNDGKRTIIGHDVWIGERALIKQGITIGSGAIIGMGSVVTKDVEPFTIVGGCPAKFIRKRFDDITIKELLEIEWWNFEEDVLKEYTKYITNPSEFIKRVKK
jgi:acetyltransferase-like isoleucine patch superfamily enzyme